MYSDVCISDFDSDDDNIAWPSQQSNNNDYINGNIGTSSTSMQNSQSEHVRGFGEFKENYGWIQCQSKSYPERVYYHNTHSGCNTWYRPISRCIDIPFVSIDAPSKVSQLETKIEWE